MRVAAARHLALGATGDEGVARSGDLAEPGPRPAIAGRDREPVSARAAGRGAEPLPFAPTEDGSPEAGALQASEAMHALRRIAEPEDLARGLGRLPSPARAWATGRALGGGGGLCPVGPR
jgi:hypothetical protein